MLRIYVFDLILEV